VRNWSGSVGRGSNHKTGGFITITTNIADRAITCGVWFTRRAKALFPRGVAVIYFIALASFYPQIPGLLSDNGLAPFQPFFQAVHEHYGARSYYLLPCLAWIHPSVAFLRLLTLAGMVVSVLAAIGFGSFLAFALLWAVYLSLVGAGQEFMSFQWDILLLEAGFLTIFYVPWDLRIWKRQSLLAPDGDPPRTAVWLVRWLLFRLMFLSGSVKLLSKDVTWRNWTALNYHYQTQPIPNAVAWYMHHAPDWFQRVSLGFMWGVELVAPFLIFTPRRVRHVAGGLLIFFQLLLIATGNFAYFNWLAIVLCWPLFEASDGNHGSDGTLRTIQRWVCVAVALFLAPVSLAEMAGRFGWDVGGSVIQQQAPFHLVNSYGLFAAMTTERLEIVVEGTADGVNWLPYEFPYKPGDLHRAPPFVAPHQPRVDWQMWFAALTEHWDNRDDRWFGRLMIRLLDGRLEVKGFFSRNPFPDRPPIAVRALLYEYRFTTAAERARTGDWWVRTPRGVYFPEVSLRAR
jgi:lipase maturation factor 1